MYLLFATGRRPLSGVEGPLPTQSMMHSLKAMARDPERVSKGSMDREKSLHLPDRLEVAHWAFPLPGGLVGYVGPVVLIPPGSMASH